jgi:hypothetical protein
MLNTLFGSWRRGSGIEKKLFSDVDFARARTTIR